MKAVPAAGVVLYRDSAQGARFLLLRNARHGTWAFPKVHADPGESNDDCARREVREETGDIGFELVDGFRHVVRYRVPDKAAGARGGGYDKEVTYFLGRLTRGEPELSKEHAEARWATAEEARALLQHAGNVEVLEAAVRALPAPGRRPR